MKDFVDKTYWRILRSFVERLRCNFCQGFEGDCTLIFVKEMEEVAIFKVPGS